MANPAGCLEIPREWLETTVASVIQGISSPGKIRRVKKLKPKVVKKKSKEIVLNRKREEEIIDIFF